MTHVMTHVMRDRKLSIRAVNSLIISLEFQVAKFQSMAVPHMAPVPPAAVRNEMLPEEWEACLDAWLTLAEYNLSMPSKKFEEQADSIAPFLTTYCHELSVIPRIHALSDKLACNRDLRQRSFVLSHRILSAGNPPKALLHWSFLADLCHAYTHSKSLEELLHSVWRRKHEVIENSISELTRSISLSKPTTRQDAATTLERLAPLLQILPETGEVIMTGSDFLDEMATSFPELSDELQKVVIVATFLGLVSLLRDNDSNASLFYDHMYSLKSNGQTADGRSLIQGLVSSTPLLARLHRFATSKNSKRLLDLRESLIQFKTQSNRPRKSTKPKRNKGKARLQEDGFGEVHVHRMSLISQIQDLFPELGTGFIAKLLSEYSDNVEEATSHLLEDSLPPHLQSADRTEALPATEAATQLSELSLPPTPLPERRNVFDNDELDKLTVDASRLRMGRDDSTADDMLSDRTMAPNKAAILSALAAFDSDDDERDDTYDVEDVGGTVDSAISEADQVNTEMQDKHEEALFRAFKSDPKIFERDGTTRRSKARQTLKNQTGLTDEAIEGWLIVTGRDARKMRRLEAKYSTWTGQQNELVGTAWRASPAGSGAEDSEDAEASAGPNRGRGRGRGRGGSRGRGGRGGNVSGPADDKGTQQARHRKEANKSSRANHNRRDQRARKMARGGGLAG